MSLSFTPGLRQMALAAVYFSVMGLLVRLVPALPAMEVVVFRTLISFCMSGVVLWYAGRSWVGKNRPLLMLRGFTGFLGLSIYIYCIQVMTLAEAVTLQYLNPIFSSMLAPWFLKEKGRRREWLAIFVAFTGVVLIANPQASGHWPVAFLGVLGAVCSGVSYNIVRKLGLQGEDPHVIVLYFPFIALVLASPFAAAHWVTPSGWEWLILLGVGVTTQLGQISMSRGLALERISRATVVNYVVIFLSTLFSFLIGDTISPSSLAGMGLIVVALLIVSYRVPSKLPQSHQ